MTEGIGAGGFILALQKMDNRSVAMSKCVFVGVVLVGFSVSAAAGENETSQLYGRRTDWNSFSGSELNISVFVFRDRNRNGTYDIGDRPMANVAVDLIGSNKTLLRRSNISGFANFKMSVLNRDADIVNRGEYEYRVHVPPGWKLTTGNSIQESFFEVVPGTPADMISSTPARPVGLAPDLFIEGELSDPNTGTQLIGISPTGEQQSIVSDDNGHFQISASPGDWQIIASNPRTAERLERYVAVIDTPVYLSAIKFGMSSGAAKSTKKLINFDDAIQAPSILEIPNGYGGLDWQNWVIAHNRNYGGEGYINSTVSGEYVAYNSSGHPVKITSEKSFDFEGGFFGLAWSKAEGETLTIKGWRADELAYQDQLTLSSLGPLYFAADYRDITRIEFATRHFWQFTADDLQIGHGD